MKRMRRVEALGSSELLRRDERIKIAVDAETHQELPPAPTEHQIKIVDSEIIEFWIPQCLIFLDDPPKDSETRISEYRQLCDAMSKHVVLN